MSWSPSPARVKRERVGGKEWVGLFSLSSLSAPSIFYALRVKLTLHFAQTRQPRPSLHTSTSLTLSPSTRDLETLTTSHTFDALPSPDPPPTARAFHADPHLFHERASGGRVKVQGTGGVSGSIQDSTQKNPHHDLIQPTPKNVGEMGEIGRSGRSGGRRPVPPPPGCAAFTHPHSRGGGRRREEGEEKGQEGETEARKFVYILRRSQGEQEAEAKREKEREVDEKMEKDREERR